MLLSSKELDKWVKRWASLDAADIRSSIANGFRMASCRAG